MRKARSEEYWENIGTISIFGTPKATISASVFGAKKHFFRPFCFETPFQSLQKIKKHPLFAHSSAPPFSAPTFSPQKHRFPALSRRNATPGSPFSRPNTLEIRTHFPRSPHHSPLLTVLFPPPACTKTHSKMYLLRRASSTFSDTARLGILSLWR